MTLTLTTCTYLDCDTVLCLSKKVRDVKLSWQCSRHVHAFAGRRGLLHFLLDIPGDLCKIKLKRKRNNEIFLTHNYFEAVSITGLCLTDSGIVPFSSTSVA